MGTKRVGLARVEALMNGLKWPDGPGRLSNAVTLTGDTTLTAATHGFHPVVITSTATLTLPAVAEGVSFWLINGCADGTLMTVSPNGDDKFLYSSDGAAGVDDKDIVNTAATAKKGDFVKLTYGSAVGWTILELGGTWADEA